MVPSKHKTPAMLAAVVTFLALVAGTTTIPTAQATDDALAARRVATKFKKINWPASPAVYGTPTFVNGKIKGKKVKKRVVVLQQKLPSGWQKVDKDKTNGKGRFHLKAKTNWYHKKIKMRVVVQATRKAAGNTSKGRGFTVNPAYVPQGDSGAWSRIAPGYKIQYNPCAPVRWRLNTQYAPDGVKPEVKAALKQLGAATGIRFVYTGKTKAIPGSSRKWPGNTNMVVAWAAPSQTKWNLLRQHHRSRRSAQDEVGPDRQGQARRADHPLRPRHGQHVRGTGRLRGSQRARLDHRPRARSRGRHRPLARPDPADVPVGREHRQRHLPGR